MGSYRFKKVTYRLLTGIALVTTLVTTFWTGSVSPTRAAPVSNPGSNTTAGYTPALESSSGSSMPQPSGALKPAAQPVPLNAVVLGTSDNTASLAQAIEHAGGTVYVQQGNALFVGLNDQSHADLAPVGARAVYQGSVSDSELAALPAEDREAIATWNQIVAKKAGKAQVVSVSDGVPTSVVLPTDRSRASSTNRLAAPSDDQQTSAYMAGNVAVRVLFVQGNSGTENWTEAQIGKAKTEIVQALDWWTAEATAPQTVGQAPRPSANLQWTITYVSPFEGPLEDRSKILVTSEPIALSIGSAAANGGWMSLIAHAFNGLPADGTALRRLAHDARTAAGTDWGFTLFVVNSANDADGYFADGKAGGAALNGPWALVSYKGGSLGIDNLEVLIAKMVGHIFGAGDESYDAINAPDAGCSQSELYGYFRIPHLNCERDNLSVAASLMRSGQNMIDAYHDSALSEPARAEVGWFDNDGDGVYDIFETLSDTFTGFTLPPICPTLHLGQIPILNVAPQPDDLGGPGPGWTSEIWDPVTHTTIPGVLFGPININWPGYVWGRVNGGEWVAGWPGDTLPNTPFTWGKDDTSYSIFLPGRAGTLNRVQIAIMNRWGQDAYPAKTPINITVKGGSSLVVPYESNDVDNVDLFNAKGVLNGDVTFPDSPPWTASSPNPGYSGADHTTMVTGEIGSEACFTFTGPEVTLFHNNDTDGTATVYVDGEVHSVITYNSTALPETKVAHVITNLSNNVHTVSIVATSGVIDFDAFQLTDSTADTTKVIDALAPPTGDIPVTDLGFYEAAKPKIQYVGLWSQITLAAPGRPGPTPDGLGMSSSRPYDHIYTFFKNADTVAIYRGVYPGGGSADVYVDGELRGTMYNDATVTRVVPFYISGLDISTVHGVEIRINPNTPHFDLDALRFLNLANDPNVCKALTSTPPLDVPVNSTTSCVNLDTTEVKYGVWTKTTTYIQSKETGALLTVFFKGSGVGVNLATSSLNGVLEMYVDGKLERTVDTKLTGSRDQPIVVHGFDPGISHVLQVRQINVVPARPKPVQIYGYTIYNVSPVGPGSYEEYLYDTSGKPTQSSFLYEEAWKTRTVTTTSAPSGKRFIESAHDQARAYLYFTGADSLTLYGVAGAYGAADIYVNGKYQGTFIEKKSSTTYNVPFTVTGFDPVATNVLELRIKIDPKLPKKISLDRVVLYKMPVLGPGTYEDNGTIPVGGTTAPALQFSGEWANVADVRTHPTGSPTPATYTMSNAIGDLVEFEVTNATSVVVYRRLYSRFGVMEVYVDGQLYTSFDNYTSSPTIGVFQQPLVITGLDPDFNHHILLKAQVYGSKLNQFKPFDVDYIVVRASDPLRVEYLETGMYENDDPAALAGNAISYVGTSWVTGSGVSTATVRGNKAVVLFKGNAFRVYVNKLGTGGKANVYIDGTLYGTINSLANPAIGDVPYTYSGLPTAIHTVQIIAQGGKFIIDKYVAYTVTPFTAGAYALDRSDPINGVLTSGQWTFNGTMLQTKEQFASLSLYVADVDSVFIQHWVNISTGDIQINVNGVLHSTIDAAYIKSLKTTSGVYVVSGLTVATHPGGWIQIINPKPKNIAIQLLDAENTTPQVTNTTTVEAEAGLVALPLPPGTLPPVLTAGWWVKKPTLPDARYSGGFYLETKNAFSEFYIPIAGLNYLTIYRPLLGSYGDAKVYIDGTFWGLMPNTSPNVQYSVPFSIGPIPNPSQKHIIELRPVKKNFGIDKVVGIGVPTLSSGYYDDSDPALTNAYIGVWKVVSDPAASKGALHQTIRNGDRLSAVFQGNQLIIYRRLASTGKVMNVYVDGVLHPVNNQYASALNNVPYTILLTDAGPHSLEIVATGGPTNFDALEINNVTPAQEGAYQQNDVFVISNGIWSSVSSAPNSGGSYETSIRKYDSVFFMFTGTQVTTYVNTGKNWGILSVYLDGLFKGSIDEYLYDKVKHPVDEQFFKYDLSDLTDGVHVLELRYEGKKNPKSGKLIVNLDAITVNGHPVPKPGQQETPVGQQGTSTEPSYGCFEDTGSAWTFFTSGPSWGVYGNDNASATWYHVGLGNIGDQVYGEFTFKATGFSLMYHTSDSGGYARVYIDGAPQPDLIDMYSDPVAFPGGKWGANTLYTVSGLTDDVHVVRIQWTGAKNILSQNANIYIDRMDIPSYFATCP